MIESFKQDKALASSVPVANAADMVARIITEIAGNDVATSINGVVQTREAIVNLATQRITNNLLAKVPARLQPNDVKAKGI